MSTTWLHSHNPFIPDLTLDVHVANTEQKTGNHLQVYALKTGLHNLTIQVLKTRLWFIDI